MSPLIPGNGVELVATANAAGYNPIFLAVDCSLLQIQRCIHMAVLKSAVSITKCEEVEKLLLVDRCTRPFEGSITRNFCWSVAAIEDVELLYIHKGNLS